MKLKKLLQLIQDNAAGTEAPRVIRSETNDEGVHIYIFDIIDSYWGASAAALISALTGAAGKDVHMHINSPGGDVFEARAMAAAIVGYAGKVVTHIDGVAASAATYLALAASEVRITQGGLFMIHNSWTFAMGDRTELRSTADLLEKIDGTIAADYVRKTGASAEQVSTWMDAETWFTADEALAAKFVDVIEPNSQGPAASSKWNLSAYEHAPEHVVQTSALLDEQVAKSLQNNRNRMRLLAQSQI